MKDIKKSLELLAPARNLEIGKLAVLAGADAVYIGAPSFGARAQAGNSWSDIASLVEFAHKYYVKVYVVLNTIFFDNEATQVKDMIWKAYELGVDALIVQDMGILEMDLPPIPLFASTQTDNYSVEQIKFLEKAGFSRVILARELSLSEIKNIAKSTKVELEAFVHGSLCVSFSGHCYFSQAMSGRSANRGVCQQACRLPFSLIDSTGKELMNEKYLLSTKDLNLISHLGELIEAGVTSFKIEGRLKDATYVANVVASYRAELDKIIAQDSNLSRAASGTVSPSFIPDLAKTFNRGYTDYFINGRSLDIVSPDNQKSLGKFIGKVKKCDHRYFTLDRNVDLHNGDGLCWLNSRGMLNGTNVNLFSDGKIYPNKWIPLAPGTLVYRNQDPVFEKEVISGVNRSVDVNIKVSEDKKGWLIKAIDEDNNQVEIILPIAKTVAEKPEQASDNWVKALSKSGDSIFKVQEVTFDWKAPGFAPLSVLNDGRRQLLEALLSERLKNYQRLEIEHQKTKHPYFIKELDYSYNVSNSLARAFYERHGAKVNEEALEKTGDNKNKRLMTTKHCLRYFLGACPKKLGASKVAFKEPLFLVYNGNKYRLKFDCQKCVMEIWNN
jgi:putative protease